jgi:hypothetical protein
MTRRCEVVVQDRCPKAVQRDLVLQPRKRYVAENGTVNQRHGPPKVSWGPKLGPALPEHTFRHKTLFGKAQVQL